MVKKTLPTPHKYASCPREGRILDYYSGQFDSVYVLLHPFMKPLSLDIKRFGPESWPSKSEILEGCEAVSWQEILALTGIENLSTLDTALKTSIGGLNKEFEDWEAANLLSEACQQLSIVYPTEGEFSPLLENRIYDALIGLDENWVWIGDEFCTERSLYWTQDLKTKEAIPNHGCLFTHNADLLLTSHWDSHCSFLGAEKSKIEKILKLGSFEGFYATPTTDVYWGLQEA